MFDSTTKFEFPTARWEVPHSKNLFSSSEPNNGLYALIHIKNGIVETIYITESQMSELRHERVIRIYAPFTTSTPVLPNVEE